MNLNTEPVAVAAAVRALLVCVAAFGVGLTGDQIAGVVLAVELVAGLLVRSRVSPVSSGGRQRRPRLRGAPRA